ncbi:MAG: phenylacetate--CoA ligase, partial [Bacteroidota bacterium]
CTPSYAQTLAEECQKRGINTKDLAIQYGVLGAEPWTDTIRTQVEAGLHIKATNIYGLSEIIGPGVSQEDVDERGTGSYVWEDHFYPEVVDKDTGEPLPYGRDGVLVFTTLTKEAMPLLRYWTNDICSLHYDSDGKRTHVKMSPIKGRADDMLIIRGVNLFHTQVEVLLHDFEALAPCYQLIVTREGTMDDVQLDVELHPDVSRHFHGQDLTKVDKIKSLGGALRQKIKQNIGLSMEVRICHHDEIPRSAGGKLSRIKDLRNL